MKNRLFKRSAILAMALAMLTTLAGCGGAAQPQASSGTSEGTRTVTLNITVPAGTAIDTGARFWADKLYEESDGRFQIEVYNSSTLSGGDLVTCVDMVREGSIDLAFSPVSGISSTVYDTTAVLLPWLWKDFDSIDKTLAMDSPAGEKLFDICSKKDVYLFGFVELGWRDLSNNVRPIHKPEDLKGLKIRVISKITTDVMNCLGANPTSISYAELYTALQQGAADGEDNPISSTIVADKLYEVQKYITRTYMTYEPQFCYCGADFWNSLTAEDQTLFTSTFAEAMQVIKDKDRQSLDGDVEMLKNSGVEVNFLTDDEQKAFRDAAQPVWDQWVPTLDQDLVQLLTDANQ